MRENKKTSKTNQFELDILSTASHELKTPLNSIYSASYVLINSYKEKFNGKPLEYIEIIYNSCQKLINLIENLLDISRIESGYMKLNLRNENIVEIIRDCIKDIMYLAEKRNIFLKMDLPEKEYLKVEKVKIEQVLTNLLSNAIKNTPPKGTVLISLNKKEKNVEIQIKDTGVGFTEVEKENLFEKFGKIKRCEENMNIASEGSGLGLYITKEIVNLHGGQIWMDSEGRNKGCIFYFTLPIINNINNKKLREIIKND